MQTSFIGKSIDNLNLTEDKESIMKHIDDNYIYIYSNDDKIKICDYLEKLYKKDKNNDSIYSLKICYQKTDLDISVITDASEKRVTKMDKLIDILDGKSKCRIIIENDKREDLAFIFQQLIYIGYPMDLVDILLRKEEKDADKSKRYSKNINDLKKKCDHAVEELEKYKKSKEKESDESIIKDIDSAIESCKTINAQLDESLKRKLKLTVAASKKSGKSVVVNSFLEREIAPTSITLATPNNCIYEKSEDDKYHLISEKERINEDGESEFFIPEEDEFQTKDLNEMHERINKKFIDAQNNPDKGFALPDMHIRYPAAKNSFSEYIITDTAGPDAAVSVYKNGKESENLHRKAAERAINDCDVSIFVIDLSKYLTETEKEYLQKIKEIFNEKNKFHSLVFSLNKMDTMYDDANSLQSVLYALDFIKNRLSEIDENFNDIILFPTSSLEYYYSIEAKNKNVNELDKEISYTELCDLTRKRKDINEPKWLFTHASKLYFNHNIENFSYDVFKKDSGMISLMDHVAYVAESKAREEIINQNTYIIDIQTKNIETIINQKENLEELIELNDSKIQEITDIINKYSSDMKEIFKEPTDYSESELKLVEGSILFNLKDKETILKSVIKGIVLASDRGVVAEEIYIKIVKVFFYKLKNHFESRKGITNNEIDNMLTDEDFINCCKDMLEEKYKKCSEEAFNTINDVSSSVKTIVKDRCERLRKKCEDCTTELKKKDINITLPGTPDFEFSTVLKQPDDNSLSFSGDIKNNYSKLLKKVFSERILKNIGRFFANFSPFRSKEFEKKMKDISIYEFNNICDREIKNSIKNQIFESKIDEQLKNLLEKYIINDYMKNVFDNIEENINSFNKVYSESIYKFKGTIDDREKYRNDSNAKTNRIESIDEINKCTRDFIETWNKIVIGK